MRLTAAAVMAAMASVASHPADQIMIRNQSLPDRRRPRRNVVASSEPTGVRPGQFVGDGFDQERIDRAERKRARRALRNV